MFLSFFVYKMFIVIKETKYIQSNGDNLKWKELSIDDIMTFSKYRNLDSNTEQRSSACVDGLTIWDLEWWRAQKVPYRNIALLRF